MEEAVDYGNTKLAFSVLRSSRKTLAIEVHPDLSIIVVAPANSSIDLIKEKVLKKAKWIVKQLDFFEQFLPRTPIREYVSGETHFYLGRKYILRVRDSEGKEVKLKGGELTVYTDDPQNRGLTKRLLGKWYYMHAKKKFDQCIEKAIGKFKMDNVPPLAIRKMSKRWGSCTPKGQIILNPEIIRAPTKCIEYVIIHELCHLVHANHSSAFYELQNDMMPGWEKWKLKLEQTLT